jgi:two-component system response regulator HydG
LPPLRARGGDILTLAQHFIVSFSERMGRPVTGLTPPAADKLMSYGWPGNVRELRNCMERAVALTRHEELMVDDLPERIQQYESRPFVVAGAEASELVPMKEVERRYIKRVLASVGGSKSAAARILGFDRKTLYRKMQRYDLAGAEEADN